MFLSQLETLPDAQKVKLQSLRNYIKALGEVCIAYSGGVDSSLVATIASEQLGHRALAVTGVSESLAPYLLREAREQANWLGIAHKECKTYEIKIPSYIENSEQRCFFCKTELYRTLKQLKQNSFKGIVIDGVNYDDLGEYRPGIKAAQFEGIFSPLAEIKITKQDVRAISKALGLPWWDKPAQPCLASRLPYGERISALRLQQISKAEEWLIKMGFSQVRVRSQGSAARIELPVHRIEELLVKLDRQIILDYFFGIGFTSVSIDLEGLVSGKLNRVLNNGQQSQNPQIDKRIFNS